MGAQLLTDELPVPPPSRPAVVDWVLAHLGGLFGDEPRASQAFVGGQSAAYDALDRFDVTGYAARRNDVFPPERRGASRLSPYIRHGLLQLRRVWNVVEGGPSRDVEKFRFELLWQEYARHWYAALGTATRGGTRYRQVGSDDPQLDPWPSDMLCVQTNLDELHIDGWVVNQARMWLSSQWSVRHDAPWQDGEEWFFRHLLDGSRAANRLGWQWTGGLSKQKVYGFSRRQVLGRAPGLCDRCSLRDDCPIVAWPNDPRRERTATDTAPSLVGPNEPVLGENHDVVWLTAESLGDDDPALSAHPDLPVVFIFDEPLLAKLQLSSKRLVFLAETLSDLAQRRTVHVYRGRPAAVLGAFHPVVTHAPVPGFRRILGQVEAGIHPWPWLRFPDGGSVQSFSHWNRRG